MRILSNFLYSLCSLRKKKQTHLFVEAILLLQNKHIVYFERETGNFGSQVHNKHASGADQDFIFFGNATKLYNGAAPLPEITKGEEIYK